MALLKFLKDPSGYCIDQRKAKVGGGGEDRLEGRKRERKGCWIIDIL